MNVNNNLLNLGIGSDNNSNAGAIYTDCVIPSPHFLAAYSVPIVASVSYFSTTLTKRCLSQQTAAQLKEIGNQYIDISRCFMISTGTFSATQMCNHNLLEWPAAGTFVISAAVFGVMKGFSQ